jgi:hypothetical protein
VRVSFELTPEEAEAMARHANSVAVDQIMGDVSGAFWPAIRLRNAVERGLDRYNARTKGET